MTAPPPAGFLLRFLAWAALFESLFHLFVAGSAAFARFLELHARIAAGLLRMVGLEVERSGAVLTIGADDFEVARGCDVTRPIGLLVAAILAFPATWRSRLRSALWGTLLLLTLNLVRILSLIQAARFSSELHRHLHLSLWPLGLILVLFAYWLRWARRELGSGARPQGQR
jgi:exosortase/archaeosortase family protein